MNKMEKNVGKAKEREGSFKSSEKEPFNERLKSLLAGRSVNQAARDWGVNLSTLKNYFSRQGSTPRHEVLLRISSYEGVSVDWLLYGGSNEFMAKSSAEVPVTEGLSESALKIASMLDLLDEEDIEALSKMLMLKGVETVLYLLDESNIRLLQLPKDERHRLLVRHEAKKGASEDSRDNDPTVAMSKQAR